MRERSAWHEVWIPLRVELTKRTAYRLVEQRHNSEPAANESWAALSDDQRWAATEEVIEVFLAAEAAAVDMLRCYGDESNPDE